MRPPLSWADLPGRRVGVLGLGTEGEANVRACRARGIEPVLVDDHPRAAGVLATSEGGLDALLACLFFTSLLTLAALPGGPQPATVLPAESSDLPADPGVHWGRLDNGLTYAVLANREPKGRVSLRLAVRTGSLYENENQRGLAHFLEHMAFNGSTHFPAGTLVEYFQRLGMNFGGDTNASTDFEHTTYQLELPDTKPETLKEAFTYFTDVAGGLLLNPTEIDKERGIIESERRARDSVEFRTFLDELDFVVPDTRVPQRIPIGTPEVLSSTT